MAGVSEYFAYLWLVPVSLFIFVPLCIGLGNLVLSLARSGCPTEKNPANEEKREYQRFIPEEGNTVEVKMVGNSCTSICTGILCDISKVGISLKELPLMFLDKVEQLTVIVRGYEEDHTLLVRPRWSLATASGNQIGAQIEGASSGWHQFLKDVEAKQY